ncbi:MAG: FAD-dependent oxidoreductase [Deltaproteobacteria bacterium]|jgi:sulfide:quinone oxidoreductase|nr:FAD-dependent oxidoreductase [Deltaproteobacteria bacterium]
MRKIVILGAGAGGTMVAANLRRELDEGEWEITVIDKNEQHHFQSGYLFIPFGIYSSGDVLKPKRDFIPTGVDFVVDNVTKVDTEQRKLETEKGDSYDYDWLVVSTGCRIVPEEVEGMMDVWGEDVFSFYTLEDALALRRKMKYFDSGKVVLNIAEFPYKCPIAPIEFVFMADWFFQVNGVRDKVEIEFVTPVDNIFTKPVAAKALRAFADKKNIKVTSHFDLAKVNANEKTIESHKGDKVGYDLLVSIPPNFGDKAITDSGMGDPMGYMPVEPHTLKAQNVDRVFVLGDATNVPTSKAGSVAHYMSYTVVENLVREIDGHEPLPSFDGHATCFLASGFEKAILLDFNYEVEPLPGKFPFPGMGPFSLLQDTFGNYWGKMMFKWVYWNLMMKGLDLPLEAQMNIAGKLRQTA